MFFLHFMLFPTFLETKFGNTIYFYFFRKTILFHLMFSSCVLLYPLYPLFPCSDFVSKMWGWFGGGGYFFCMLEILKIALSLTATG